MAKSSTKPVSSPTRPMTPEKRNVPTASGKAIKQAAPTAKRPALGSSATKPAKPTLPAKSSKSSQPSKANGAVLTSKLKQKPAEKPTPKLPNSSKKPVQKPPVTVGAKSSSAGSNSAVRSKSGTAKQLAPPKPSAKSNAAPVAKSAPVKAAPAGSATQATKVTHVPKSSPKPTAPAAAKPNPPSVKSSSKVGSLASATTAKTATTTATKKAPPTAKQPPSALGVAVKPMTKPASPVGKAAAKPESKSSETKSSAKSAKASQPEPAPPQQPTALPTAQPSVIAKTAAKPAKAGGKVAKATGKGAKILQIEAPVAPPVVVPVKKAVPKAVPIVAVKSPSPAAKYPPVNADDEFLGIEKLTDAEFIAQQLDMLGHVLSVALGQARMLQAEADQLAAEMEPGDVQFDDESGEGASASMEREKDLAMAAEKVLAAEDIERAITRLRNNSYGSCTNCNRPIPRMRLRALPQATLCIECKNGGLSRRS